MCLVCSAFFVEIDASLRYFKLCLAVSSTPFCILTVFEDFCLVFSGMPRYSKKKNGGFVQRKKGTMPSPLDQGQPRKRKAVGQEYRWRLLLELLNLVLVCL